ncbi:MAG: hypothetical protein KDA37_18390, partial [Planctomycetales bacterium]|nr:hypothetical protein [Planctomycetales bacterium]
FRVTSRLEGRQDPVRRIDLSLENSQVASSTEPAAIANAILGYLDRWAFESEPADLHLHAGCVVSKTGAILLVGASGAGKSSLVLHLSEGGLGYATDEVVKLDRLARVEGLRRPIAIKRQGWHVFEGQFDDLAAQKLLTFRDRLRRWSRPTLRLHSVSQSLRAPAADDSVVATEVSTRFVSPRELVQPEGLEPWCARVVVFCERQHTGVVRLQPVSAAVGVTRLLAHCFDADRLGREAFERLLRLAASATFVVAEYQEGADVVAPLRALVDTAVERHAAVTRVPPAGSTGLRRSPRTISWVIDNEVVIAEKSSGITVALGGSIVPLWELLEGGVGLDDVVHSLATITGESPALIRHDVSGALEDLDRHGFIEW